MDVGFIGAGKMGGELVRAFSKRARAIIFDKDERITSSFKEGGFEVKNSLEALVSASEILILATKPKDVPSLIEKIAEIKPEGKSLVSVAAGVPLKLLERSGLPSTRLMPSMTLKVKRGIFAVLFGEGFPNEHRKFLLEVLRAEGSVFEVGSDVEIDIFTATSASAPGYLSIIFESFEDACVRLGLKREMAKRLCVEVFTSSALLYLEGNPKAEVMTPGGTTAEAVFAMEKGGVRATIMEVVEKAFLKCQDVSYPSR